MKKLLVIGIGAGNPDYLTVQAINALSKTDVVFMIDKGPEKEELIRLRQEICERYMRQPYRLVTAKDPERDRTPSAYEREVKSWHSERADIYERVLGNDVADGEHVALLVWGDPSLYDSTLRIIEEVVVRGTVEFEYEVIPGITSIQALAAGHKIPLNRIGEAIHITTGRHLSKGFPPGQDNVVVMLDAGGSFRSIPEHEDVDIYWGAYLGTDGEILIKGKLTEVGEQIERVRAEARQRHGWIMDTFIVRRN